MSAKALWDLIESVETTLEQTVEDVELMLAAREDPDVISQRLGLSTSALSKRLWRAGSPTHQIFDSAEKKALRAGRDQH